MGFDETIASEDFLGLDEPQQIARLSADHQVFRSAYARAPEKTRELLRSKVGYGADNPPEYSDFIAKAARQHRMDPRLISSQIWAESNFRPDAVSNKGAKGLMQFMDPTAEEMGLANPHDPETSIMAGAAYMRKQYDRFGNWPDALAAYNAGATRVQRYGSDLSKWPKEFQETKDYVPKIMDRWEGQKPPPAPEQLSPGTTKAPPNVPPPKGEPTPAGSSGADRALRQAGYGFAESFTDLAQGVAYATNWVLSTVGLPETDIAESIGAWEQENLPEPTTPEGRIGRAVGHGAGFGLQSAVGGAGIARAGIPYLSRAAKFITARPGVELAAGAAGGGASALAGEHTDSKLAQIGAGLAGAVTAGGLVEGIARRGGRAALVGEVDIQEEGIKAARAAEEASYFDDLTLSVDGKPSGKVVGGVSNEAARKARRDSADLTPVDSQEAEIMERMFKGQDTRGKCIKCATQFAKRIDGDLVEGSVLSPAYDPPKRIKHAWVEKDGVTYDIDSRTAVKSSEYNLALDAKVLHRERGVDAYARAKKTGKFAFVTSADDFHRLSTDQMARMDVPPEAVKAATEAHGMEVMRGMEHDVAKTLDQEAIGGLTGAYKDFLKANPDFIPLPGQSVTLNVRDAVREGSEEILDNIKPIVERNGITVEDFVMGFQATTSNAGRLLQTLSTARKVEKRILKHLEASLEGTGKKLSQADEIRLKELDGVDIEPMNFWRRLENVRRGLLVTQMSTAMRNAETQVANLTVNTLGQLMEGAAHQIFKGGAKVVGKEWKPDRPAAAFGSLVNLFVRPLKTKRQVEELMRQDVFVEDMHRLFFRGASEAENIASIGKTGVLTGMETVTRILNFANRFQEYNIRRAVFAAELDRSLAVSGRNLASIEAAGDMAKIDRRHIKQAVDRALEMTWGREFSPNPLKTVGQSPAQRLAERRRLKPKVAKAREDRASTRGADGKLRDRTPEEIEDAARLRDLEQMGIQVPGGQPSKFDAEGMAGSIINLVNKIGFGPVRLTWLLPFPRFMMNSFKWQYEHSPLALNKLLYSKDEWAKVATGDLSTITKAATGTALLMSAYQIRNSEHAGEKWYQIKPGVEQAEFLRDTLGVDMFSYEDDGSLKMGLDGKPLIGSFDTRPFNPFASYLFLADIANRIQKNTLNQLDLKDVVMGIMATNLRAGAGLYLVDKVIDDWTQSIQINLNENLTPEERDQAMAENFMKGIIGFGGAAMSGMLVPFQQLNDVLESFDQAMGQEPSPVKDARADPVFGQFRTKLSAFGAAEGLPDVELATRSEPPRRLGPGMRQATGLGARGAKSVGEQELDRLDFNMSEILNMTGNDAYDRLMKKYMGPAFERYVNPKVRSARYQRAGDAQKAEMLRGWMQTARASAKRKANREDRGLAREVKEGRKPRRQQRAEGSRNRDRAAAREAYLRREGVISAGD